MDRRWRRALAFGWLAAVLLHLAVFLLFRSSRLPPMPFAAAGPPAGDVRAAEGGGSGLTMVDVRVQEPQPEAEPEPTPEPTPTPVPEEIVVEPREVTPAPVEDAPAATPPSLPGTGGPGTGGREGQQEGPGTESGTGQGGGGTEEEGRSGLEAPTPRGLILPPADRPRSVRGRELTVWVFVNERGRVVPDSTRLEPPTPDARYNQRLKRSAAEWVFDPARRQGRPVAAWYPYEIIL